LRKDDYQWKKKVLEYDWVKIVNSLDKPWVMIPKYMVKQCWDKVDKMQKHQTNINKHKNEPIACVCNWV
jgi:hypothetical protein